MASTSSIVGQSSARAPARVVEEIVEASTSVGHPIASPLRHGPLDRAIVKSRLRRRLLEANPSCSGSLLAKDPELAAFLDEIPVREGTLLQLAKRWITAVKKLGKLERERAALVAKEAHTPRDSSAVTRLRLDWIRLVSLVLANLELSRAKPQAIGFTAPKPRA